MILVIAGLIIGTVIIIAVIKFATGNGFLFGKKKK